MPREECPLGGSRPFELIKMIVALSLGNQRLREMHTGSAAHWIGERAHFPLSTLISYVILSRLMSTWNSSLSACKNGIQSVDCTGLPRELDKKRCVLGGGHCYFLQQEISEAAPFTSLPTLP